MVRGSGSRGGALFALGIGLVALALLTGGGGASAAPGGGGFNLAILTTISPDDTTYITAPSGDGTRLFIVGQQGRIRLIKNGALLPTPFLDIDPLVNCCGERGLLSMAFAPDYVTSGLFYVYYTAENPLGAITIDEFRRSDADPDIADPASRRNVLQFPHSRGNHNGGQLQFGPDGYLYAGTGDGGGAGDPDRAGQNLTTLAGKILRIDPRGAGHGEYTIPPDNPFYNQPPSRGEIWSFGLRNPWRFSFDRQTGDLTIGDVGQSAYEEIDFSPRASGYGRGTNYAWSCREGRHPFNMNQPLCLIQPPPIFTEPVHEYSHARGCSITGGYVIRDPALPAVFGRYVYGDYCSSPLWHIQLQVPDAQGDTDSGEDIGGLFTFGEDACARVYAGAGSGLVYRLIPTNPPPPPDVCAPRGGTLIGSIDDETGQEISLRDPQGNNLNGGTLPAGTYTVQVDDTSTLHNFHLEGPGVQCVPPSDCMTDPAEVGRETWLVNFTPGSVTYHCDPHPDIMGSFTVVEGPPPPPPPPPPSSSSSSSSTAAAASATASSTAAAATAATASTTTAASATASTTTASATAASATTASTTTASASPPPPPPPPARCRVPRVLGLRLGNARQRIRRANCSVGRVRRVRTRRALRGRVIGQSPRPGAVRRRGFPVNLLVGRR